MYRRVCGTDAPTSLQRIHTHNIDTSLAPSSVPSDAQLRISFLRHLTFSRSRSQRLATLHTRAFARTQQRLICNLRFAAWHRHSSSVRSFWRLQSLHIRLAATICTVNSSILVSATTRPRRTTTSQEWNRLAQSGKLHRSRNWIPFQNATEIRTSSINCFTTTKRSKHFSLSLSLAMSHRHRPTDMHYYCYYYCNSCCCCCCCRWCYGTTTAISGYYVCDGSTNIFASYLVCSFLSQLNTHTHSRAPAAHFVGKL